MIHVFKSTDTGAPALSGTAGTLVTLLDALLVDGYNSKTITITRSGTTATANCTGHNFNAGQTLVISGANETDYNLTTRVTIIDANNFSYTVANDPTTPATGTITAKVAPLGWTKAYSGTNKAAYRQKSGTNQFYLRVDDNGTGSATYARVVGYESMSDVDTGSNAFPTNTQVSGGCYAYKSSAASATARAWRMYSDGRIFHLLLKGDGSYWSRPLTFGDFKSFKAGDAYGTMIRCSDTSAGWTSQDGGQASIAWTSSAGAVSGVYIARSYTQSGTASASSENSVMHTLVTSMNGAGTINVTYPAPIVGGLIMAPVILREGTANVGPRGSVPGIWTTAHDLYNSASFNDLDTWTGAAGSELDGRTFEITKQSYGSGAFVMEISDTWES